MGLDQTAQKIKTTYDLENKTTTLIKTEIADWRKHNRLHGWMEELYYKKSSNPKEVFNCDDLFLHEEDLDELEKTLKNQELPTTEGFFFGTDSYIDDLDEDGEVVYSYVRDELPNDLQFIKDARKALKDGYDVVYSCWW
tara:strand:+ start:705 stop:1121 length:417 start_codon:yes stop_codon:yes gene_type:complete